MFMCISCRGPRITQRHFEDLEFLISLGQPRLAPKSNELQQSSEGTFNLVEWPNKAE